MFDNTRVLLRDLWQLARPYWNSEEKVTARLLLVAVVALTLAMVYMSVQFNSWYNDFYNTLEKKNSAEFFHQMWKFGGLAAVFIGMYVYQFYLRQMLQIRWRRWMTDYYLKDWLADGIYYRMQLRAEETDNPDQRIADDMDKFVGGTLDLSLGLLDAVVTFVSFVGILWGLSGGFAFVLGGARYEIYGYMVWVAIVYALVGSVLAHLLGRPLIDLNFKQQRFEADFRFSLARFRENTEGVALYRGEGSEMSVFTARFSALLGNWIRIMQRQKLFNFYATTYGQLAVIFPFLVGAPRFFSGAIPLGGLMQISNAFGEVQRSLSWFINAYTTFASWRATVDRLTGFHNAIAQARTQTASSNGFVTSPSTGPLTVESLTLSLPDGRPLIANARAEFAPGDSVMVSGPSGSGKSTLLRALAGIWPFATGRLRLPSDFEPLFLPQRPYFPLSDLRHAVAYPSDPGAIGDESIREALTAVGLPHLAERLDEVTNWSQQLSGGEQQRVAIARALLIRPRWLFLDEATSNLDEAAEMRMYSLLTERLPGTSIVSIAHRPALAAFHRRVLEIDPAQHRLVEAPAPA
ncbi:MAG: ABC transporter ATP-binding protein/permease [Burkholderiales bacterium]